MKKKLLVCVLAAALAFAVCGCGEGIEDRGSEVSREESTPVSGEAGGNTPSRDDPSGAGDASADDGKTVASDAGGAQVDGNAGTPIEEMDFAGEYTLSTDSTGETYILLNHTSDGGYWFAFESHETKAEEYWKEGYLASVEPDGSRAPFFVWAESIYGGWSSEYAEFDAQGNTPDTGAPSEFGNSVSIVFHTDGSFALTNSRGSESVTGTFIKK